MPFIDETDMLRGSPLAGWSGRFFHSENMTFAYWDIAEDAADLHEHDHVQEEVWNIIDGEVVVVVDGDRRRLGPGAVAVVPPNVRHSVETVGACKAIIVDYPVRHELPGVRGT